MESNDIIIDFLDESRDNLLRLEQDLLALEAEPTSLSTLASVFRTFHTFKGSSGLLGFPKLESLTHAAESLLGEARAGQLVLTRPVIDVLLQTVDVINQALLAIESTGAEPIGDHGDLMARLCSWQTADDDPLPAGPIDLIEPIGDTRRLDGGETSVRIDIGLLDRLMNLAGELVLARNQVLQHAARQSDAGMAAAAQRLNLITSELQAGIMQSRLQPIGNLWNKLPRQVRDLAQACDKAVRLDLQGADTELDRSLLEAIRDPIIHLIRNAIDHGIEPEPVRSARGKPSVGTLRLRSYHEGGRVILEIGDDGGGLDLARIGQQAVARGLISPERLERISERDLMHLIFLPGFSTADQVTRLSGRGVGMDVVKTNVEAIGGTIDMQSRLGEGTIFSIKIPLTLAIIPALIVSSAAERYAIPQVSLVELVRLTAEQRRDDIETIGDTPVFHLRGKVLPLVFLHRALNPTAEPPTASGLTIVILRAVDQSFGLVVDAVHDVEEIVVQPLAKQLKGLATYAGATILGDGCVALILDVAGLARHADVIRQGAEPSAATSATSASGQDAERQMLLILRGQDDGRLAVPLSAVARLERFRRSAVEPMGNHAVVQYRGEILRLVELSHLLAERRKQPRHAAMPVPTDDLSVVVYAGGGQRIGLIVDMILDIVEDTFVVQQTGGRHGVVGSRVLNGRVTELLDLSALIMGHLPVGKESRKEGSR